MIKNRDNFILKKYMQPDRYRLIGTNWNAIYKHPVTGQEYHIELQANFSHHPNKLYAPSVAVLRQDKDCRRRMGPSYKTIKAAVDALEAIFAEPVQQPEPLSA